jgi:protein-L-isoaspartate O-methyltransferase
MAKAKKISLERQQVAKLYSELVASQLVKFPAKGLEALGWPECGPFDAIVVTAALGQPPPLLIEQLKVGGRLVMPVGPGYTTQQLTVVEKIARGETTTRAVALVRFVPFTRSQN